SSRRSCAHRRAGRRLRAGLRAQRRPGRWSAWSSPRAGAPHRTLLSRGFEHFAQVVRVDLGAGSVVFVDAKPALRIENIRARRMIERIASRRLARLLLIDDLELFGHLRRRLVVPVQAEKRWVERGNVTGEYIRRIAPRVDGDEQNLNPAGFGPELLHRGGKLCERRRTEVRALRLSEKNDDCLAAKVGERARLAVVIDEVKVA